MSRNVGLSSKEVDPIHRNRTAHSVVDHEQPEPDGRFGRSYGQNQQGEDLSQGIVEGEGEPNPVEVDGQEHQFDTHQQDEDVLTVERHPT